MMIADKMDIIGAYTNGPTSTNGSDNSRTNTL